MKYDANILRIANDLIAWTHPSWMARHAVSGKYPSRFQNRLLFERTELNPLPPAELALWPVWSVKSWDDLTAAIYLCGARLARSALLLNDRAGKLEHRAERILSYPLPGFDSQQVLSRLPPKADASIVRKLVLEEGWRCLLGAHPGLPASLSSRLRLRLPVDCSLADACSPSSSAASYRQLWHHALGFCHAENH